MKPCIIWSLPRSGSTVLGKALGALNEPLQRANQTWATPWETFVLMQDAYHDGERSIKHLYEECPDEVNVTLATYANFYNYRHIHLVRVNELARLVSRDICTQLDAWTPDMASPKFAGLARLRALDIDHLMDMHRMGRERWKVVSEKLPTVLTVMMEDITAKDCARRRQSLRQIAAYLELPTIEQLERAVTSGSQNTETVWKLAPNIGELRRALTAEG